MTPAALAAACVLFASSTAAPPPPIEKAKAEKPALEIGGRVYARETFAPVRGPDASAGPWAGRLGLESARIGAKYRTGDVVFEIEAELEGEPELKDAYAKLDLPYGAAVQAGQFKAPFAALALESTWTLPIVDRGLLDELLIDRLQIGGRRPGAQVEWRGDQTWRPKIELGAWQGTDQEGEPREDASGEAMGETAGGRLSAKPFAALEFGVSGAWRAAQPVITSAFERFWAAGADAVIDTESGARAWLEGGAGSSWADDDPGDGSHATFAYGRGVLAWRLGGRARGAPYVEAFGSSGVIDPVLRVRDDLVVESAAGVNAGRWKQWRGQVQLQSARASRNTPLSLMGSEAVASRAVLLQVGFGF